MDPIMKKIIFKYHSIPLTILFIVLFYKWINPGIMYPVVICGLYLLFFRKPSKPIYFSLGMYVLLLFMIKDKTITHYIVATFIVISINLISIKTRKFEHSN